MATAPEAVSDKLQTGNTARHALSKKYKSKITANPSLTRSIVSYQANRKREYYRWFKYKEGFSAALVEYVIASLGRRAKRVLDPFAGSGAALFASREFNKDVTGIELLPVGEYAIRARLAAEVVSQGEFRLEVQCFQRSDWRKTSNPELVFQHFAITKNAFSAKTT